jgi:hypothetical protein
MANKMVANIKSLTTETRGLNKEVESLYKSIEKLNAINEGYNISLGGDGGDTISNNPKKREIAKIHSEKMKM